MLPNLPFVVVKDARDEGDDCGQAAAAAAAATAAVLEDDDPWIVVNEELTSASFETPSPPLEPAESPSSPSQSPFYGHLSSFEFRDLSAEEAASIHAGLDKEYNRFCRVTMKGPEDYRTIRLEPSAVRCRPAEAWHAGRWKPPLGSTSSFSFALAVEKSVNCYVNVGLVEWKAARKEADEDHQQDTVAPATSTQSLADILKVKSDAEDDPTDSSQRSCECPGKDEVPGGWLPEQHVDENPRQMMLGCRKGVQWFGNAAKYPLFQDNIMAGSLLRFRCDYHLNRQGDIAQVKIWMLASPIHFEYGGEHTVKESDLWCEPLAQWWGPRWSSQEKKIRTAWVPAVTLYTKEDVVTVAWQSPDVN